MKFLDNLTQKKLIVYIFSLICISSLIISYICKINLSNIFGVTNQSPFLLQFNINAKNGGVVSDLATHWQYIKILREDISNLFLYEMGVDAKLLNYPLHHIIFSQLYLLSDDIKKYLLVYFCFSLTLPYIFYLNLSSIFKEINKYKLISISSLIYIAPIFQYSAIWGNNHITALFFFLIGTLFHIKLRNINYKKKVYSIISIFFLSLAAYTRQYYAFFFLFIFLEYFVKFNFRSLLLVSLFAFLLSIPGILFLIKSPILLFGIKQEITNFSSSILISASICFFYIVPFIIQYFFNNYKKFNNTVKIFFNLKIFFISLTIFLLCLPFFNYQGNIGGGILYKFFVIILNQKLIFFIISFFGIYFILFFTKKNIYSILLSALILCTFSSGTFIFQKYFEPMFFIIFLLFFDKKKLKNCLSKNNHIIICYFVIYYLLINYIYFFGL